MIFHSFAAMMIQNNDFWEKKYVNNEIGWDLGGVSEPLKNYFDQLENKDLEILIPGAGNAYEAEYLHHLGFKNVHVIDWAQSALDNFKKRVSTFPTKNLHQVDFFAFEGKFDLVVEQTFFCAITPDLRTKYVDKMHNLLNPKGKIAGLLFNIPLNTEHPPYGGNQAEYEMLFTEKFNIKTMETAHNSIAPRHGNELFVIFEKK